MSLRTACIVALTIALTACAASDGYKRHTHPPRPATGMPTTALTDPKGMRIHLINVGQGASTLIEFPCAAVLIDTGGEDNDDFHSTAELMKYLDWFFKQRPDLKNTLAAVYLTHPHIDHTRGSQAVFEHYKVLNVITDGLDTSSGGDEQQWLEEHAKAAHIGLFAVNADAVPVGGLTNDIIDPVKCTDVDPQVHALWGAVAAAQTGDWDPKDAENMNNHSVVLRFDVGEASFLVMGDLELPGIADLIAKQAASGILDVDVLEVGHHGSHNATTDKLLEAVTPNVALISVGDSARHDNYSAWQWGHPRKVTVQRLVGYTHSKRPRKTVEVATGMHNFDDFGIRKAVYATGWDGNVVLEMHDHEDPKVWTTR